MTKSNRSVLLVDDQDGWRSLLFELLKDEFEVTAVATYEQAVREIRSRTPAYHVVITDMRLIDADQGNEHGLRLIEQLKRESTRAIVITGYPTFASFQRAAFGLHVHYYFEKVPSNNKPFDADQFLEIVRKAAQDAELSRTNLAFVLMPFAEEFQVFYENEIKFTIESLGYSCKRVDDFFGSRRILGDIQECIADARLIVADLTGCNPNVFFEVGIAHALGKNVLLLTQNLTEVPPYFRTLRCIAYEKTWVGAARLVEKLKKAILETQEKIDFSLFERKEFVQDRQQCFALIPDTAAGHQAYRELILRAVDHKYASRASTDVFNSSSTRNEVWEILGKARLIVADLSERDPGVFYLAGLAYALEKKVIYMARDQLDVPFDLQEGSCLVYSIETYESGLLAKQRLSQLIEELLG